MGCVEKESLRDDQTEPQVGGGGYSKAECKASSNISYMSVSIP